MKSMAARKDVQVKAKGGSFVHKGEAQGNGELVAQSGERLPAGGRSGVQIPPAAGTQAPPVDTTLRPGRPRTGFDKAAYNRNYMRNKRARSKASKPIQ